MLKSHLPKLITCVLSALGGMILTIPPQSLAVTFSNRDLDQNKIIAIAQPSNRGTYSLIIIEQINNQRPCWQEQGNNPVQVQPLLLDFDFTGICERSTDSNGYSLRVGGEDLDSQYRLQIIREGNNLKLIATPFRDRTLPRIEIGQTNGIAEDFTKIILNNGWTFTKRVYEGQTLGHIYLTNNDNFNTVVANFANRPTTTTPISYNNQNTNINSNSPTTVVVNSDHNNWIEFNSNPNNGSNSNYNDDLAPNLPNPTPSNNNRSGRSIPDFSSSPDNLPVVPVPQPPPLNTSSGGTTPSPSPLASTLGFNYRVIVYTRNVSEENKVKTIVPDAFRTRINNQIVLQAGLFVDQNEADLLRQRLSQQGLNVSIIPVN